MNRIPPGRAKAGGKGAKDDKKVLTLGVEEKAADTAKLLERCRKRFDQCVTWESQNRIDGLEDLKFKKGDQWPAAIAAQRNYDNRPCFTVNKMPTFTHQITNEQRQNRPSINVSPVGDRGDPEVAKMYRGLIRFFERASHADLAYDTAFDYGVSMGWGYWRMTTEYDDPKTFNQTICIKRIRNNFSVYLDPYAQEPDGADARYAFITEMVPREDFEAEFPKADPMSWTESGPGDTFKNWVQKESIRIAEYFEISEKDRTLVYLSNGHEGWKDELADEVKTAIERGTMEIVAERESKIPTVKWYKVTAVEVLEEREWLGRWIPLCRVIGDEIDIEGRVTLSGVIRNAKEAQRLDNYVHTMMIETIALQPKAPFVGAEGQFEGHEDSWEQANVKSFSYLQYKPTALQGNLLPPPQRQTPSLPTQGWEQLHTLAAQAMMATTGIRFDATLQERVVDESGRALRELRRSSDTGSLHYYDNLCRALKHQGDMFLDLIPKIIDTRRMMTILREDDTEEQVMIDPNAEKPYSEGRHPVTGKTLKIFNPKIGKYGITVTIGPSYATKRIEAAESMMDFVRALPQTAALVADLVAKNQDWPEAEQIAARLAKTIPPHLLAPDMKDVPPQVQALLQGMDQQVKQLTAQLATAMQQLNDKTADRAVEADKIEKQFEAALLKVVADVETKMAKVQEQAVANYNTHITAQMQALADGVKGLEGALGEGKEKKEATAAIVIPPAVVKQLAAGQVTKFANGSRWTLRDGKPHRVADA